MNYISLTLHSHQRLQKLLFITLNTLETVISGFWELQQIWAESRPASPAQQCSAVIKRKPLLAARLTLSNEQSLTCIQYCLLAILDINNLLSSFCHSSLSLTLKPFLKPGKLGMCGGRNVVSLVTPPKTALPARPDWHSPLTRPPTVQPDSAELSSRYSAWVDTLAAKFVVHSNDDIEIRIFKNTTAKNNKHFDHLPVHCVRGVKKYRLRILEGSCKNQVNWQPLSPITNPQIPKPLSPKSLESHGPPYPTHP